MGQAKFENTCYLLLQGAGVTDNTSVRTLMSGFGLGSPQWQEESFQKELLKRLQQPDLVAQFVQTVSELRDVLDFLGSSSKTGTTHEHKVA